MFGKTSLPTKEGSKPGFFYGWVIVIASFFALLGVWGTHYTFGVFFKPLLKEFGWTRTLVSGVFSLYFIIHAVWQPIVGGISDRVSPRIMVAIAGFLVGLGFLLASRVTAIWHLYLFYSLIIGIGVTFVYIPCASAVAKWFVKRKGLATGIMVAGIGSGATIMPPVTNYLISNYGWRNSYAIIGLFVLVIVIVAALFLRQSPEEKGLLPYGAVGKGEEERATNHPSPQVVDFSLREALRTRAFWMLFVSYLFACVCIMMIGVHIVPHVIDLGFSAAVGATTLGLIGAGSIVGRISFGAVSDEIGRKATFVICFMLQAAMVFAFIVTKEAWLFYLIGLIYGFAYGGWVPQYPTIISELFGSRSHGLIFGVVLLGAGIGGAIGPLLAGHIYDATSSYSLAFSIATVMSVLAAGCTLLVKETKKRGLMN